MPEIWRTFPDAELWLVGSNPPESLRALAVEDSRIKVTGFVESVQQILRTMSVVICPWSGTYGFRSRLVEVMALGVPVVASADAAYGMDLSSGKGIFLCEDIEELVSRTLDLLREPGLAVEQSRLARQQVEDLFSLDNTYIRLMRELSECVIARPGIEPL
jgi:glycosyltransferase involved in cell wall biosynthesis